MNIFVWYLNNIYILYTQPSIWISLHHHHLQLLSLIGFVCISIILQCHLPDALKVSPCSEVFDSQVDCFPIFLAR